MRGRDWAVWRNRLGYSTQAIMKELDIGSRQTISNWEKAEEVPRLAVLALHALEHHPECREVAGQPISGSDYNKYLEALIEGKVHE